MSRMTIVFAARRVHVRPVSHVRDKSFGAAIGKLRSDGGPNVEKRRCAIFKRSLTS